MRVQEHAVKGYVYHTVFTVDCYYQILAHVLEVGRGLVQKIVAEQILMANCFAHGA